jgi:hypothetical protein
MSWIVDFYEDAEGKAPVEEFLDSLTEQQRQGSCSDKGVGAARADIALSLLLSG